MVIEEGKKAPPFTLEDASGAKVSLSDFAGQHVIVYFYPRDDTPGCTKEACGFRDLHRAIEKHDAVVLGISPETRRRTRASRRSTSSRSCCCPIPTRR